MYSDDQDDWEKHIRSDLWNEMSTQQLSVQIELVLDKLSTLSYLPQGDPTVVMIRSALVVASNDLNNLINNRMSSQQQKGPM
jgi:hypothetical protein